MSRIAMLTPAWRPMANAAWPTVPLGTSIDWEAAWPGAARDRSAESVALAISSRIPSPFLPSPSPGLIAAKIRPEGVPATWDRASLQQPTMCH